MNNIRIFQVGGSVRDELLGVKSNDIDYSVEILNSSDPYNEMKTFILHKNYEIFLESPKFFTIKAKIKSQNNVKSQTVDFALCRIDGEYTDNRRPDNVKNATILEDLSRRDFTINAIAKDETGNYLDPFNGINDLKNKKLRCVGNPYDRINEDPLRAIRAIRFTITKDLIIDDNLFEILKSEELASKLQFVSKERIQGELLKMFSFNTVKSIEYICQLHVETQKVLFKNGLWLKPTLEKIK